MAIITGKTLIVSADAARLHSWAEALGELGPCLSCDSAHGALKLLQSEPIDVVVVCIDLPDMTAFGLAQQAGFQSKSPKLILLSSDRSNDCCRQALHCGAFDLLPDDVDLQELQEVVAHARRSLVNDPTSGRSDGQDNLTGLTSHRAFLDALDRSRSQCRRRGQALALMLLDLDRFREINTTYSRAVGDQVLAKVGQLLQRTCRNADVIARYSWDRFVVSFSHACGEGDAGALAKRCLDSLLNQSLHIDGHSITISASIGLTESGIGFTENAADLIEQAEQALAVAKRAGGRRIQDFHALARRAPSRRQLMGASVGDVSHWIGLAHQQLRQACLDSTHSLVGAVEAKDPYTRRHSLQVSHIAEVLGQRLGLPEPFIQTLKTAALLHDVGKIGVPDAVLRKPGPLTDNEFDLIRQHPQTALQILGHSSFLNRELPIILHHHERFDGDGYPDGLRGNQIPFGARILAVADSIDAMASARSYKSRFSTQRIIEELNECAGRQWDPAVVQAAVNWLETEPEAIEQADPLPV